MVEMRNMKPILTEIKPRLYFVKCNPLSQTNFRKQCYGGIPSDYLINITKQKPVRVMFIIPLWVPVALIVWPFVLLLFALTPLPNLHSRFAFCHCRLKAHLFAAPLPAAMGRWISRRRTNEFGYAIWKPRRWPPLAISSGSLIYLHLLIFFYTYIRRIIYPVEEPDKHTDPTLNNCVGSLKGSSVLDLRLKMWLCTKARESEYHYPWQNISDRDNMENLPSWQA